MKSLAYVEYYLYDLTKIEHDNILFAVNQFNANNYLKSLNDKSMRLDCEEMSAETAQKDDYELMFTHVPVELYAWLVQFVQTAVTMPPVKKRKYRTVKVHG